MNLLQADLPKIRFDPVLKTTIWAAMCLGVAFVPTLFSVGDRVLPFAVKWR
jgi:hypothetical protein